MSKLYTLILLILLSFSTLLSNVDDECKHLLSLYEKAKAPKEKLKYLFEIIDITNDKVDVNNAKYLNLADSISRANNLTFEMGITNLKSAIFWRRFDKTMTFGDLFDAKKIFEKLKDQHYIAEVHREIGETYRSSGSKEKALLYLDTALNIYRSLNDSFGIAKTYNRMGATYHEIGNIKESIKYLELSMKYLNNGQDAQFRLNNLIILIAIYRDINQYDKSLMYFKTAEDLLDQVTDKTYVPFLYNNIVRLYARTGEPEKVIKCIDTCIAICEGANIPFHYYHSLYNMLSDAYVSTGKPYKAIEALKKAVDINQIIQEETQKKKILRHQFLYETKLKDKELEYHKNINIYQYVIFISSFAFILVIVIVLMKRHKDTKIINATINEKNEKLECLNATKDKFFSIIAHDLKNPIASFKQVSEILFDEYDKISEDERKEFIENLKISSTHLYNLLENLLSWSRSQSGNIEFKPEITRLNYLVNNTISHLYPQAVNKKIKLVSKVPEDLEISLDANLTSTVIRNLVSNAIKYSESNKEIFVITENKENELIIEVKDQGIGMDESTRAKLFKIDNTKSQHGTQGESGTGLGLIVCKEFIEKQGGKIWVESEMGKGSSFKFTIPYTN